MNNRERQEYEERKVFAEFAKVCRLPLLANTLEKRPAPEPDVLCDLKTGDKLAFELVSCEDVLNDNTPVQMFATYGGYVRPCILPRIKGKLSRRYQSSHPIHLLAWSDTASAEELTLLGLNEELAALLQSIGIGPFARIWIFGRASNEIAFDSEEWLHKL